MKTCKEGNFPDTQNYHAFNFYVLKTIFKQKVVFLTTPKHTLIFFLEDKESYLPVLTIAL